MGAHRLGYGLPVQVMLPLLARLRNSPASDTAPFAIPSLEIRFNTVELSKLRRLPQRLRPSAQWLNSLSAAGDSALQVCGVTAGGPCDGLLAAGDILVSIGGEVVCTASAVEAKLNKILQELECKLPHREVPVQLTLLRRGRRHDWGVRVPLLPSDGKTRILCWHGLVLQEIPRSVREFGAVPAGVHIAQTMLGSPAEASGLEGEFLVAVDGAPTPTLDALVACSKKTTKDLQQGSRCRAKRWHLRVETADMNGRHFVKSLEPDHLFWPLCQMSQDSRGAWRCGEAVAL